MNKYEVEMHSLHTNDGKNKLQTRSHLYHSG